MRLGRHKPHFLDDIKQCCGIQQSQLQVERSVRTRFLCFFNVCKSVKEIWGISDIFQLLNGWRCNFNNSIWTELIFIKGFRDLKKAETCFSLMPRNVTFWTPLIILEGMSGLKLSRLPPHRHPSDCFGCLLMTFYGHTGCPPHGQCKLLCGSELQEETLCDRGRTQWEAGNRQDSVLWPRHQHVEPEGCHAGRSQMHQRCKFPRSHLCCG